MAERVSFPSTTGPRLAGLVDLPEGEVRGWGVLSHGFTLGKDSPAASRLITVRRDMRRSELPAGAGDGHCTAAGASPRGRDVPTTRRAR